MNNQKLHEEMIMKQNKNENAVSPVIGVILMVGITILLAAVIAAFVFGMAGNISKTKIVAVGVDKLDSSTISAIYRGGQDAQAFNYATVHITDDDGNYIKVDNLTNSVGNTVVAKSNNKFTGNNYVIVVGYFVDGSVQLILETRV